MRNIYRMPKAKSAHYLNRYIHFISSITNDQDLICEKHHILPRSMGGGDDMNNIIRLTPRQHYLAHWMLYKAYQSREMTAAFFSMSNQSNQHQHRRQYQSSKIYEQLRIAFRNDISISTTDRWTDPVYRQKHTDSNNNIKTKSLRSAKAKQLWQDPEYREKMLVLRKTAWSEGRIKRDHSKCGVRGENNPAKRPEVKAKNSGDNHYSNRSGYVRPTCPHCGKTTTVTNMKRWHGINCKSIIV